MTFWLVHFLQGGIPLILSMTGFGKGEYSEDGTCVTVEVSSVNGRFFDLKTKMPKSLVEFESKLRTVVQEYIDRGRVTVSIYVDQPGHRADAVEVDTVLAKKYITLAGELAALNDIENNLDVRTLFTLPDVVKREENGFDAVAMWDMVERAVRPALDAHRAMRVSEGAAIGDDMKQRLLVINEVVEEIGRLAPQAVEANTSRLRAKIDAFVGAERFDEARFAMEIAVYADRVDITEERVRLASHCEQYAHELDQDKTSGRKLSFLLQEMNRETNTIASKASDAGISQLVVRVKEELEKMREQAENME